ncbi:MAG: hypothetical protein OXH53_04060 [bacterium]|nr:hypothetical protein [bacterium]
MPLTRLDETLRHQIPTTFDHVGTSDPRFFDRYWFSCYDPAGSLTMIIGVGLYMNMNVFDGFVACQVPRDGGGSSQRNFRFSRALRPDIDRVGVGPLDIEIIEPFERVRLTASGDDLPIDMDLTWTSFIPPKEEDHHFSRVRGRVTQDYRRYTQVGRMDGAVTLDGTDYTVEGWWGGRDHSWGVRPQTAGPEPVTGEDGIDVRAQHGSVFYWLPFSCPDYGGHVQIHSTGDGRQHYLDGVIARPDGKETEVVSAEFEVDFWEGTRRWRQVRSQFTDTAGEVYEIETNQIHRDWAMIGTGYDWGWEDGGGLGVYRGQYYSETDTFDLSHPENVVLPSGEVRVPGHREAPAVGTVNGQPLAGHQIVICSGRVPFLGLDDDVRPW